MKHREQIGNGSAPTDEKSQWIWTAVIASVGTFHPLGNSEHTE